MDLPALVRSCVIPSYVKRRLEAKRMLQRKNARQRKAEKRKREVDIPGRTKKRKRNDMAEHNMRVRCGSAAWLFLGVSSTMRFKRKWSSISFQ